ncbi:MAG: VCBS repeat-containing protein [Chloroflexota bacterium]
MKSRAFLGLVILLASISLVLTGGAQTRGDRAAPQAATAIQAPVLKWQHGGCYSSWCETSWYSSPAVADLDGDGTAEIIGSAYSIVVLDGATGSLEWRVKSGYDRNIDPDTVSNVGRTWAGIVVADVDGDNQLEIVTAHEGGYISVYNQLGFFEAGWPQHPIDTEFRGLVIYDLDNEGTMEIIASAGVGNKTNTWVYEHDGSLRAGWPQLTNDSGYASGVFNDNAAVGDIDGDSYGEIIVPSDMHFICAYEADGSQIPTNSIYGDIGWGKVGVWESLTTEVRGWGTCNPLDGREERYRANFSRGVSTIADLNNDGSTEIIAVGDVYDCIPGYPTKYYGLFIFNADRSRFNTGGFNWETIPTDIGAPLSEDYNEIKLSMPNPAVADLDGDGNQEILFASFDGFMHVFWLDKIEHGNWPYPVYNAGEGFVRFASEPAIADLDNDGYAEVIFTSWVEIGSNETGKLHILDYLGNPIHEIDLPDYFGNEDWNGALPAPTLADIDGDPDLEVVLNTAHSGFVAYDLPGTANARILWGTGRGSYLRNGTPVSFDNFVYLPLVIEE